MLRSCRGLCETPLLENVKTVERLSVRRLTRVVGAVRGYICGVRPQTRVCRSLRDGLVDASLIVDDDYTHVVEIAGRIERCATAAEEGLRVCVEEVERIS